MTFGDPHWLDTMYDNRARVPGHAAYFRRWAESSAQVRSRYPDAIDLRYGDGPGEALDVFASSAGGDGAPAPVLFYIHGGYWRSLDKSDQSFVAPPFTDAGVCVVVPNYALCPGTVDRPVTIGHIAAQMRQALTWTVANIAAHAGDPARITVVGHSAGGHLAAELLTDATASVRQAIALSGLFDLRPLMHTPSLQSALRLTATEAVRLSPALSPAPVSRRLAAVVGADESDEFLRHTRLMREAWGDAAVPVCEALPGLDHFGIVDALADPSHALHRLVLHWLHAAT